jgi:uncharacterized protein YndB with AHSA1/START domain
MSWKECSPFTCDFPDVGLAMSVKQPVNAAVTRLFGASPQRVFNAWVDSDQAGKWLFAKTGEIVCLEMDARTGGWFYIAERRNRETVEYVGEYLEVVAPQRLVFMLLAEKYSPSFERVTVVFNPHEIGCQVSLTHETRRELAQRARSDWSRLLDRLAALLGENSCHAAWGSRSARSGMPV